MKSVSVTIQVNATQQTKRVFFISKLWCSDYPLALHQEDSFAFAAAESHIKEGSDSFHACICVKKS